MYSTHASHACRFRALVVWLGLCAVLLFACGPVRATAPTATLPLPTLPPSSPPAPTAGAGLAATATGLPPAGTYLFDDFTYTSQDAMQANGWIIRDKAGWPGVPGAIWSQDTVALVDDPALPGNRLVQMTSSSDGQTTYQNQICHQRKYYEGTYATRVHFSDAPASGAGGDQIVETFYMISPLEKPMDPDYSEMDYEYLPNGGWGAPGATFFMTTWETAQLDPWVADNASDDIAGSQDGWHTLVLQVTGGEVRYYLDGRLAATHGGKFYPEVPMSINYNLWFIDGGLLKQGERREYREWIDWVYFVAGQALSPDEVTAKVAELRHGATSFHDTVPPWTPALPSPCNF